MKILWNKEEYSIGDEYIDIQHAYLLDVFNQLHNYMIRGEAIDRIDDVLNNLKIYVSSHFQEEEKLMVENNVPGFANHVKLHNFFIEKLDDFILQVEKGDKKNVPLESFEFLKDWITNHIKKTDNHIKNYI